MSADYSYRYYDDAYLWFWVKKYKWSFKPYGVEPEDLYQEYKLYVLEEKAKGRVPPRHTPNNWFWKYLSYFRDYKKRADIRNTYGTMNYKGRIISFEKCLVEDERVIGNSLWEQGYQTTLDIINQLPAIPINQTWRVLIWKQRGYTVGEIQTTLKIKKPGDVSILYKRALKQAYKALSLWKEDEKKFMKRIYERQVSATLMAKRRAQ